MCAVCGDLVFAVQEAKVLVCGSRGCLSLGGEPGAVVCHYPCVDDHIRSLKHTSGFARSVGSMTGFPCPGCSKGITKTRWRPAVSSRRETDRASADEAFVRAVFEDKQRRDLAIAARREARGSRGVATNATNAANATNATNATNAANATMSRIAACGEPLGAGVAARIQQPPSPPTIVGLEIPESRQKALRHRPRGGEAAAINAVQASEAAESAAVREALRVADEAEEHDAFVRDLLSGLQL